MDVICSIGFGLDVSAQTNPDNPFIKYSKRVLETSPAGMPKFILYILFPDLADMFPRFFETSVLSKDILDFFLTTTRSLFEDRKQSESKHKDLLQLMVNASYLAETEKVSDNQRKGLTDEEILINSIIFMLAGYDTTAAGISWVLYELALNPEIQEKLVTAIDDEIGENKDKINEYAYLPFGMTVISILRKYKIFKGSELKVPLPRSPYGLARPGAPVYLRFELRGRNT
ncbi:hypothetical protein DPMN_094664 [Dreissena polymorpha]|uniref:Cytochrome P450 n=1 Tax=Dreissena polymorpha TaxID=45954 RepID=A0A9D4R3R2_DREPO|nr:hypothetical protein DPMN_094664 [Dreissena polymorpha]